MLLNRMIISSSGRDIPKAVQELSKEVPGSPHTTIFKVVGFLLNDDKRLKHGETRKATWKRWWPRTSRESINQHGNLKKKTKLPTKSLSTSTLRYLTISLRIFPV